MARKKKKKAKNKSSSLGMLPAAELEKRGTEALSAGKFQRARDFYKALYKGDPERYREPLIQAYQGILRTMLTKGMAEQAEVVITRIREIGGDQTGPDPLLLVHTAFQKGDFRTVSRICTTWFREHEAASALEGRPFADALICSTDGRTSREEATTSAVRDALAVREAIGALGRGNYGMVLDMIRAVGTTSPCYPWKLFLKGLCSFYREEDAKARALLAAIPAESPLHTAAAVWHILAGDREMLEVRFRDDTLLRHLCTAAGIEKGPEVLARAEYLWRVNRHRDSLKTVIERIPGFPANDGSILQSLTTFYFNAALSMQPDRGYEYTDALYERLEPGRSGFGSLTYTYARTMALLEERFGYSSDDVREAWEEFIAMAKRFKRLSALEESLVYERIADACAKEATTGDEMPDFPMPLRREVEFPEAAEKYYRRSIEMHPHNREAHTKLLALYERWKRKRQINRTLDEMIRLFPEDAGCLTRAGLLAVRRNAYNKGMDYLRRGLAVNPLDMEVRERFVTGSILTALALACKGDADRSLGLLEPALEAGKESAHDFTLGHPYLNARWAGLALLTGRVDDSVKLYEDAVAAVPDRLYVDYFCFLMWTLYGVDHPFVREVERRVRKALSSKPSGERASWLIDAWRYASRAGDDDSAWFMQDEYRRIGAYAVKAVKRTHDTGRLRHMLSFAAHEPTNRRLARKCIDTLLKRDPGDPAARLHQILMSSPDATLIRDPQKLEAMLTPIRDRARREGLNDIVATAQKVIESARFMKRMFDMLPQEVAGAALGEVLSEQGDTSEDTEPRPAPRSPAPSRRRPPHQETAPDGHQMSLFDQEPEED